MASVNKAILVGNLGQDPEVRTTQNGTKVVTLSIATSESWRDRSSGERKEKTEWHRVVIFGGQDNDGLAGIAEQYLRKGSKAYIEGKIQTRKWQDQQGQDRYSTEIVLQGFGATLVLLDRSEGGGNRPPPPDDPDDYGRPSSGNRNGGNGRPQANRGQDYRGNDPNTGSYGGGGFDDDIPFSPEWR